MLDIRLGRSSGVDLLTHLRAQRPDLICVMMTAHADTQTAIAAMRQGAYDYFDKSSEPAELLAVLDRCFEKSRLQVENRAAYDALRVAKEAAEKANRAKSEFLANISHELRTPLNAIIGFSEVMMQGILGPVANESYLGYLKDIHDSGIDLLNIINDILDLSKAEAGKLELSEQTVDVAAVLDAVCRLMAAKIDGAGLTVVTHLAPKLSLLFCDRLKLKQILLNLLSNAVKFTPAGGRIEITAASDAERGFAIAIRDTGIGIATEDIPRVLQPFEQVESSLSRSHNGTGLGLPLTAGDDAAPRRLDRDRERDRAGHHRHHQVRIRAARRCARGRRRRRGPRRRPRRRARRCRKRRVAQFAGRLRLSPRGGNQPQNWREAMRAPAAIAASLAHTTAGSTAACPTQVP